METLESVRQVEEAVICALLSSESAIWQVAPVLKPEMFSDPLLSFIYTAIRTLNDRREKADLVTTDIEMHRLNEKRWQEVNGIAAINTVMTQIRHTGNLKQYVEEVKRQYMLRLLATLFTTLQAKAHSFDSSYMALIEEAESSLLELREDGIAGKQISRIGKTANDVLKMHRERLENGVDTMRIRTGIEEFDYVTGGLYKGELTVGAGRPGDGKTAVAMQIAVNAAMAGKHVCFFSLEMTALQTMNRLFAGYGGVDANHLRIDGANPDDLAKMEKMADEFQNLPLYFDHTSANSVENIRAQVMLQKRKKQCDLAVVDYLHLMKMENHGKDTVDQMIGRNIQGLKQLALDADIPILVLSQMNRNSVNRADKAHIPDLHDLRDSGVIEQVADCVYFVYIPEHYGITTDELTGESLHLVGKLYIRKTRNGSTGIARYRYNESYTRITNYIRRRS
ncbi:DnaB-like helicase C-terminal domain-containing protein [uncultured Parabacteroides sp.]|uniref:replicative DNA helicase n=1 Tax=uncultured Parabacteroides sp. TaxID=512312 RepID=UPI0025E26007|nr:DnaB-like helicase C-terminal domain-containing protein [uncultured Parabacteroides sp.]